MKGPLRRALLVLSGPLAFLAVLLTSPMGLEGDARLTLAATAWVGAWWVFEALPIPVTSLMPLVLLPLLGLRSAKSVASLYLNDLIFLLLGGFLLAQTIERWGLHRRVALFVLQRVGTSPRRLAFGFLLSSGVLSMWISNTATTLMLLPIALAVASRLQGVIEQAHLRRVQIGLLLCVAYGANVGGLGTYIGTPPNLIFRERYDVDFLAGQPGGAPAISFLQWFLIFSPMVMVLLPVIWTIVAGRLPKGGGEEARAVLGGEARKLPAWSTGEVMVAALFGVTALLWITREPIQIGGSAYLGWTRWFPDHFVITDGTVAIAMAILAFVVFAPVRGGDSNDAAHPNGSSDPDGDSGRVRWAPLLEWRQAESALPWGILLLFGGGFALGDTFKTSGLSQELGEQLSGGLARWPPLAVIGSICTMMTFLTEVTSNTASTNVILPILSAVARDLNLPPAGILLPATLSASCAFMLPVATAPNAIVFATGKVPIRAMVLLGLGINLAAVLIISLWLRWIALPWLGLGFE